MSTRMDEWMERAARAEALLEPLHERTAQLEAQNAALVDALVEARTWVQRVPCQLESAAGVMEQRLAAALSNTADAARAFVERIRAEERDACAKLVEKSEGSGTAYEESVQPLQDYYAALIRARKP